MNDPHVVRLRYAFVVVDTRHEFEAAPPWDGRLDDFDFHLDAGALEATPVGHYPDEASARASLEPLLRAWELQSELEDNIRIEFRFQTSQLVDLRPTPGELTVAVNAVDQAALTDEVTVKLGHNTYPVPPERPLAASALVDELLVWVRGLRDRRQPMLVPANLLLTRLEFEYGGREHAATTLNVSSNVLRKLGWLANMNDPAERRKVKGPIRSLTEPERLWLLATLPRLVLQVAQVEAGSKPALLDMGALPTM